MKILFIGIFDTNEPNVAFRNALRQSADDYIEIAWNSYADRSVLQNDIISASNKLNPQLVFMQLQGAHIISGYTLNVLKKSGAFLCQWTGDARQPLPHHYIDFGKKINLSLFTNQDDVDVLLHHGVNADYLQVSADHTIYNPFGSVMKGTVPEIVFMGNNYGNTFLLSDYRLKMCKFLKHTYGDRFGLYGANYPEGLATGNLMFNQLKEAEVYRSCKIAINCSHYDLKKYTSDRFFRILLSGSFCISKEFPEMDEYSPGENFVSFKNFDELKSMIDHYLQNETERLKISQAGYEYARKHCTWLDRINQLLKLVKKWNG